MLATVVREGRVFSFLAEIKNNIPLLAHQHNGLSLLGCQLSVDGMRLTSIFKIRHLEIVFDCLLLDREGE